MSIKETTFHPPIVIRKFTMEHIDRAIRTFHHRKSVTTYRQGDHDVMDSRWNKQTHTWNLRVRRDGTGVLNVQPTEDESVIAQLGIPDELLEVTQILQPGSHTAVLMGSQRVGQNFENVIFKTLEYVPDEV